ncbi:type II toxin-antitoxin system RelE/ParE family toxin [Sandaracinobacteroides saxicola]|uniref:Type II toxin-antitoxin system RelE/ParE family toxin n=1 Tax=Sandaracinobacteroides saxicola TaxID=2759707 RepID=A0A7G5IFK1_9SPHN|nr:type II toxin-antitoxin system RelE/ParE family toxin [Sandaracinobacteroides saxicola]QMW22143.1 type II toxin-antitoxin system RelE/ParE family toxin [Sandaracinobacteroides saxicola]
MISSFKDRAARSIFEGKLARSLPPNLQTRAFTKLAMLHAAETLDDLRNPPGNRLHALSGDRDGQHSISISMQWRICFVWKDGHVHDVEIVDYH